MTERTSSDDARIYLVGAGIASLAAAAFLIRDGDIPGQNITILEESSKIGGSLDAAGTPKDGYVMRGGRMIESKYLCTFELFSSIPTLDTTKTVTQEIFDWNETMRTSSKSRLFRDRHRVDAPKFGLSERDILNIERLEIEPEALLGRSSISDQFDPSFFETDFWFMWCTTFAFQPWHSAVEFKRYLVRFTHMVSGFNTLRGIMRTVYNQYDSMVRPLQKWLEEREVRFQLNTRVTDLRFLHDSSGYNVQRIVCNHDGRVDEMKIGKKDIVMVTAGSMTEATSFGSMDSAPVLKGKSDGGSWALWEKIAADQPQLPFGRPANFTDHIQESKWVSFTTTLRGMMPFITSQFLRRAEGDRPKVIPEGLTNLAFIGQFCEIPDDVVFTVEYSIRSAQMAVYSLLGLNRTPPPVYKGSHDPRVLLKAFLTLH